MLIASSSKVSSLFFITAIVRIEFTMIIVITMPLWILFNFIPVLKKLSRTIFSSFVGCCFAPIIIALILFVGEQYTTAHPTEALQQWITVLSIATLAQTFLIILAPKFESVLRKDTVASVACVQTNIFLPSRKFGYFFCIAEIIFMLLFFL